MKSTCNCKGMNNNTKIRIDIYDENRLKSEMEEIKRDKDYEMYKGAFNSLMKKVNTSPDFFDLPPEQQKETMLNMIKQEREKRRE